MCRHFFLIAAITIVTGTFAEQDPCRCNVRMYIQDSDSAGTNLRTSPKGDVVLILPDKVSCFHGITVCDANGGWFRIKKIDADCSVEMDVKSPLWIHGSVVATGLSPEVGADIPVYSQPSSKAKTDKMFTDSFKLIGCQDGWLKCYFTDGEMKGKAGWLAPENQCGNPLTTCP